MDSIPQTFGALVAFLGLVAPGLLFELLRERRRPSIEETTFREASRVALTSLAFTSWAVLLLAVAKLVAPGAVVDPGQWLRSGREYAAAHPTLVASTIFVEVALACLLVVLADRALGRRTKGHIVNGSIWFQLFRQRRPANSTAWVHARLTDSSEIWGYVGDYTPGEQLDNRELAIVGPALRIRQPGARASMPLNRWSSIAIRGDSISWMKVTYVDNVTRRIRPAVIPPHSDPSPRELSRMVDNVALKILRWGVFAVTAAGVVAAFANNGSLVIPTSRALGFASAVVLVLFLLLELAQLPASAGTRGYGWTTVLLGADGRFSTSKSAVWLWTVGLAYALLFLTGVVIFVRPAAGAKIFSPGNWDDYLVLLGGPYAAAVLAKFAVVSKLSSGTLSKSLVPGTSNPAAQGAADPTATTGLSDLVKNDSGGLDLVDSQYFVFNIVAFAFAAGVFISNNFSASVTAASGKYALPVIPSTLLALTGASAATYVANKTAQKTGPTISTVTPSTALNAGATVTILGTNLVPQGTPASQAAAQTTVWLSVDDNSVPATTISSTSATPKKVTFTMPPGYPAKTVHLYVVSAGGVPTGSYPIDAA